MTPQEQQLVAELFDRLSNLETATRDPDAARLIAEGAQRAPHALYALVQTVLVQDEALKRASARIQDLQQELEAQGGAEQPQQQQGSFLGSMRDAVFGHGAARGSVPSMQPPANAGAAGSAYQSQGYAPPRAAPTFPAQPAYPTQPSYPPGAGFAPAGGSFLGTAASVAAGAIGGGLLLDGVRSMFGHRAGVAGSDPFAFAVPRDDVLPRRGDAADSDLARQAGIDDIGPKDTGPRDTVVNQADDSNLTDASDDQFVADDNDDDFDTADSGSGDDSYDV
ncbi:MAG TPA: DUF2076 domain-containing protein [Xanthobacteraceae bacterium]|jgi:hypothetical protein|nr:DUF2076 domain-containing protein [Xanthobacteraceae bacterium]